jgi:hypothetical protein
VVCKNGAFIKIGANEIFYRLENAETINLRKKFTCDDKELTLKGDFIYKIAPNDTLKVTFEEYEAIEISNIKPNESKYEFGQKIYAQGGVTSSSSSNLTGEYTEFTVIKVDDSGRIEELKITSPGKYIKPPSNPVKIMDSEGEVIEADIEFEETSQLSILDRHVAFVEERENKTIIGLSYPLPPTVEKGEFTISKQVLFLDKAYVGESIENHRCEMTFDFSPVNGIPLLPPASIDPHATFNEAVKIIEQKLLMLEKRISNVENRNH